MKVLAIILGALVAVIIVGSLILDGILTSKAHAQAAELSQQWRRPLTIDKVSTRIFTGLGARISGVTIGKGEGESVPLVQLQEVVVSVGLLPHFHVSSAEVH